MKFYKSLLTGAPVSIDIRNKYIRVLVSKGNKVFRGMVVTPLSLFDWAEQEGYTILSGIPTHLYAAPGEETKLNQIFN